MIAEMFGRFVSENIRVSLVKSRNTGPAKTMNGLDKVVRKKCEHCKGLDCYYYQLPLTTAAQRGCSQCVSFFAKLNFLDIGYNGVNNVNVKDTMGEVPLHDVVRTKHIGVVRQLLDYKATVDANSPIIIRNGRKWGYTPLYVLSELVSQSPKNTAHYQEMIEIAKLLIDRGARKELDKTDEWVQALARAHKNCLLNVKTFAGIRKKMKLFSARDTHNIIIQMLWATRFEKIWIK